MTVASPVCCSRLQGRQRGKHFSDEPCQIQPPHPDTVQCVLQARAQAEAQMHAHARAQMQAQAQAASSARAHTEAEAAAASAATTAAAQAAAEAHFHESAMAASQIQYNEPAATAPEPTQAGYGEVAAPIQAPPSGHLSQVGAAARESSQDGYEEAGAQVQGPTSTHPGEVAAAVQGHYEAPVTGTAHAGADAADQGLQLNDHCGMLQRQTHQFAPRVGNCHSAPTCTAVDSPLLGVVKASMLGPVRVHACS